MKTEQSKKAWHEALRYIAGGVNSPVRSMQNVGTTPFFVKKAKDSILTDIDDNQYIDYCLSWGVFILGHNHSLVNKAVRAAIDNGTSYGIPALAETRLAEMIVDAIPSAEKVRFVSSGTEAVMSAIRLARGFTKRNMIVKFDGCYHGHSDQLLVAAGSGAASLHASSSSGVPNAFVQYTISLPFNDLEAVENTFKQFGNDIAAIIVEPVPANMGVVLPKSDFLAFLRKITKQHGSLLIFDEVITGFRFCYGGVQQLFGIASDLTVLGKIVGGGFPAAAFGGKAEIMNELAPVGQVYQAGTLSGNPIAMTAGIATLQQLGKADFYTNLERKTDIFIDKLKHSISDKGIILNRFGSMFSLFFSGKPEINNFEDVKNCDAKKFATFYRSLLEKNDYFSPSPFEANFISAKHNERQLDDTIKKVTSSL